MKPNRVANTGNERKSSQPKAALAKTGLAIAKTTIRKPLPAKTGITRSTSAASKKKNMPANLFQGESGSQNVYALIKAVREGIGFGNFKKLYEEAPFSIAEWAGYLHVSERTMQRYQKEEGTFAPPQSEKILEIILLIKKGEEVFGEAENFYAWLQATNLALGNIKPKELLDSSFGINLLNEELIRIEHGIFA